MVTLHVVCCSVAVIPLATFLLSKRTSNGKRDGLILSV